MKKTIKTIDIQTREWFDKVNGNSYFSAHVTVNYQMEGERTFVLPFQYGYGSHSESMALKCLQTEFPYLPATFYDIRKSGVIVRSHKRENCLKRDLINPTVKESRKAAKDGWSYYPYFQT